MFLAPLIRWLANHHNPQVVVFVGIILVVAAIAFAAAGITIHQPSVTRIGLLLMIASIVTFVIRSRRARADQRERDRIAE